MNGFDLPIPLKWAGQKYRTELECAGALGLVKQSGAGAEAGVEAALGQEFIVLAALDDFAVVEDEDLVGVADGGQSVSYDKAGPLLQKPVEGLLDEFLRGVVDAGGGFVEEEDGGIFQQSAGDGDALLFADA
jgi:hypothetical protein